MQPSRHKVFTQIMPYLSPAVACLLEGLNGEQLGTLEEIRLRRGQPLLLRLDQRELTLDKHGRVHSNLSAGYRITEEDMYRTLASISDNSLYAFEEDIRRGFITIPGGHRVGLAGQVVYQGQEVRTLRDFNGICLRVAREVKDVARSLLPVIFRGPGGGAVSTLLISPPRCGKTTLLRDLARLISTGGEWGPGHNVVIVDERSELAGCYRGVPQLDVGPRTDVLDACPKAVGMQMAVRSLSPGVVVTDEIGRSEDGEAIQECIHSGVVVLSSVHAASRAELENRPVMKELLALRAFAAGVVLSRRNGPGTIKEIIRWDGI
jgi:stage III sporulation protein AA